MVEDLKHTFCWCFRGNAVGYRDCTIEGPFMEYIGALIAPWEITCKFHAHFTNISFFYCSWKCNSFDYSGSWLCFGILFSLIWWNVSVLLHLKTLLVFCFSRLKTKYSNTFRHGFSLDFILKQMNIYLHQHAWIKTYFLTKKQSFGKWCHHTANCSECKNQMREWDLEREREIERDGAERERGPSHDHIDNKFHCSSIPDISQVESWLEQLWT